LLPISIALIVRHLHAPIFARGRIARMCARHAIMLRICAQIKPHNGV
jgi:hypothetical protein